MYSRTLGAFLCGFAVCFFWWLGAEAILQGNLRFMEPANGVLMCASVPIPSVMIQWVPFSIIGIQKRTAMWNTLNS